PGRVNWRRDDPLALRCVIASLDLPSRLQLEWAPAPCAIQEPQPMFDFDRVIERRGTHATKWDNMARLSGIVSPDAIPMWVADMDFAAPPGVTEALAVETRRGVYGYYADTGSWAESLAAWMQRRHG